MLMNGYRIIDAHAHIFPEKIREKAVGAIGDFYDIPMEKKGSAEEILSFKDSLGIMYSQVLSVATFPRQVIRINDFLEEEITAHEEFIGFATIHPDMEDEELESEVERILHMHFKGIKLHPDFQKFDLDSENAKRFFSILDGRLPVLLHMGDNRMTYSHPRRLYNLTKLFPNQIFIGAHFGGYNAWDDAEEYLIGKTGIYIDTSSSLFKLDHERATGFIRKHGVEKTLFGTDYPMWDPKEELERFFDLKLTDREREDILFNNCAKLHGLI